MQGGSIEYRQRDGYSVDDGVRSSALSKHGSASESRPGGRHGKGSDRRRREEVSRGIAEESSEAISEASPIVDAAVVNAAAYLDESPGRSAGASFGDSSGDRPGDGSSGGSPDTSSGSVGDSAWDCVWCKADDSGQADAPQACPKHELLHSLALQELAIAHLIRAEAETAQAVATASPGLEERIAFQHSVAKVLELAVETEKLLLTKLRLLLSKSAARSDSSRRKGDASGA